MTFKVVRNTAGNVIAFGPNDNNYEPSLGAGEALTVENTAPALTKSADEIAADSKLTGIEILGVMCSATKADQMGLTAVGLDYSMTTAGGGTFGSTKFEFANGNTLVITADNFATIYNLWVPFRRSFFAP